MFKTLEGLNVNNHGWNPWEKLIKISPNPERVEHEKTILYGGFTFNPFRVVWLEKLRYFLPPHFIRSYSRLTHSGLLNVTK